MLHRQTLKVLYSAAALAFLAAIAASDTHAAPTTIVARHSSKCLNVRGGLEAIQDGALIEQWTCYGAANHQQWTLQDRGGAHLEVVAQHSGKCIEAVDGGTANGTSIQQMACNGAPRQRWTIQSGGAAGEWRLVHVPSNRCLDVTGGVAATQNGAPLKLMDCTGAANQTWTTNQPLVLGRTRDPLQWPFAQNSIWNMPIGSGAVYVAANLRAIPDNPNDGIDAIWSSMPKIDEEHIILRPTAPMTVIQYSDARWTGRDRCVATNETRGGLPIEVPMPRDYVQPHSDDNASAAFLLPDGRTLIQMQPFARCVAGGHGTAAMVPWDDGKHADLFGDGRVGAHGGSKLSSIGGSIRVGELRPGQRGMRHALKVNVYEKTDFHSCDGTTNPCFRWPAFKSDDPINYGSIRDNPNRGMKMGALLAIPASIDIAAIGLESEPGRQIAWTLQNYGAYIVDSTGGPAFALSAEEGPDGSKAAEFQRDWGMSLEARVQDNTPWTRDLQRIVPRLHVVENNGQASIGGGGAPRQPLASPLIAPLPPRNLSVQ